MAGLAWHYGEPLSDSSSLVTYALSRETRQSVTVALTGDGADENLLGYCSYFRYGAMRRGTAPERGRRLEDGSTTASAIAPDQGRLASDTYGYLMETFREGHKLAGYDLAMLPYLDRCSYDHLFPRTVDGATPEEQAGRYDVATYLPDDLLVKVDIAAMAHGLETRAPFLNHTLAEWVARIPGDHKVWDNEGKALLKSALEPYLPHECMYRTKVGFRVPVAKFMRDEFARRPKRCSSVSVFLIGASCGGDCRRPAPPNTAYGRQNHGRSAVEIWWRWKCGSCTCDRRCWQRAARRSTTIPSAFAQKPARGEHALAISDLEEIGHRVDFTPIVADIAVIACAAVTSGRSSISTANQLRACGIFQIARERPPRTTSAISSIKSQRNRFRAATYPVLQQSARRLGWPTVRALSARPDLRPHRLRAAVGMAVQRDVLARRCGTCGTMARTKSRFTFITKTIRGETASA